MGLWNTGMENENHCDSPKGSWGGGGCTLSNTLAPVACSVAAGTNAIEVGPYSVTEVTWTP